MVKNDGDDNDDDEVEEIAESDVEESNAEDGVAELNAEDAELMYGIRKIEDYYRLVIQPEKDRKAKEK